MADVCLEPSDFLDAYLPFPPDGPTRPKPPAVNFNTVTGFKDARDLAERWVDCVNRVRSLCSGYVICLSQESWDPTFRRLDDKVDGAIYLRRKHPTDGRPHWGRQQALIEFTNGYGIISDVDPYGKGHDLARTRMAVAAYAGHAFAHQQRTANFMFCVNRTEFRVVRWERAGPTFSKAFNYVDDPELMCEFLWRFSMLSEEDIGFDCSAKLLGKRHRWYKLMDEIARGPLKGQPADISTDEGTVVSLCPDSSSQPTPLGAFKYIREAFAASLNDDEWPRYRVAVPTGRPADGHFKYFLVGKPATPPSGMVGQGTRGYVAVDLDTKRFVWLKDSWRPYYVDVEAEGDILRRLHELHVPKVPTLICAGDIRQETQMHHHWERDCRTQARGETGQGSRGSKRDRSGAVKGHGKNNDRQPCPHHRSHYRLVVHEVCLPLIDFKTSRQLIQVVSDCVEAHEGAVTKARLLHRNINISNVGILPALVEEDGRATVKWMGLLNDWEQSKLIPKDGESDRARQPAREANWQFSSAALQRWDWLPADVEDDIESFFRIIVYAGVRFLRNTIRAYGNAGRAREFILNHYNLCEYEDGKRRCTSTKLYSVWSGTLRLGPTKLRFDRDGQDPWEPTGHPLDAVLDGMLPLFMARYAMLEHERVLFQWVEESKRTRTRIEKPLPPRNLPQSIHDSAAQLETHVYFRDLLRRLLQDGDWPTEDYLGDIYAAPDDDSDAETTFPFSDDEADRDAQAVSKDDNDSGSPASKRIKRAMDLAREVGHYYR